MKDTLGYDVKEGDYVCWSGKGNGHGEYGMITGRVTRLSKNAAWICRLDFNHFRSSTKPYGPYRKTISKKEGKFVKVNPPRFC